MKAAYSDVSKAASRCQPYSDGFKGAQREKRITELEVGRCSGKVDWPGFLCRMHMGLK